LKPRYLYPLILLIVILIDQVTKVIVKLNMPLHDEFNVIAPLLKIHFIENPGAAFGMVFSDFLPVSDYMAKVLLTIISLAIVSVLFYYFIKTLGISAKASLFIAFILGGAVGNIIDRVFYGVIFSQINDYEGGLFFGQVVDMIFVDIGNVMIPEWIPGWGGQYYYLWPVFNVADIAITIGVIGVIIFQSAFAHQFSPQSKPQTSGESHSDSAQTSITPSSSNMAIEGTAPDTDNS
jgi:signal peptidase II